MELDGVESRSSKGKLRQKVNGGEGHSSKGKFGVDIFSYDSFMKALEAGDWDNRSNGVKELKLRNL
ncbi:hypothetical protein ACSBR1_019040 [Camellia fascicularis]